MEFTGIKGEVKDTLRGYPDVSFNGCLCDPPYEVKYMGRNWDSSGIAFDVDMWKEVYRVLTPGAYLLAFGFPRTHHRLMLAIEDAGFELRDVLMWCYTSGFPKAASCLKPAWEPIVLAYKQGAYQAPLNIAQCRIGNVPRWNKTANNVVGSGWGMRPQYEEKTQQGKSVNGRWPSNLLFSQDDETQQLSPYFFCSKAGKKEKDAGLAIPNPHPTVKPIDLCKHLASLIMPPTSATLTTHRLLIPFSGVGSEVIGAIRAGWQDVVGVEQDFNYTEITKLRVRHWCPEVIVI